MTEEKIPKILAAMYLYYSELVPPCTSKDFLEGNTYLSISKALNCKVAVSFKSGVVIVRNDIGRFEFPIKELRNWNFSFEEVAHD